MDPKDEAGLILVLLVVGAGFCYGIYLLVKGFFK